MRVLKFGGTSVATAQRLRQVAAIVADAAAQDRIVVVVSALAGTTDALVEATRLAEVGDEAFRPIVKALRRRHLQCFQELEPSTVVLRVRAELGHQLNKLSRLLEGVALLQECPLSVRDRILACGERLSVQLLTTALRSLGRAAEAVDGGELIVTNDHYGEAVVDLAATRQRTVTRLARLAGLVPVVTGFIGATPAGRTTTLGRGGSDYSASLLGAVLDADRVEIWTDVDGVLSAPPRLVGSARPLPHLSYEEAAELAFFGAKVLHPKTMQPLVCSHIPIRICNTVQPRELGTTISAAAAPTGNARALSVVENATLLTVEPLMSGSPVVLGSLLHEALAELPDEVLLVSQASAAQRLQLVVGSGRADHVERVLRRRLSRYDSAADVRIDRDDSVSLLAAVGQEIHQQPWVAGQLLSALGSRRIPVRALLTGASPHSITVLVDRELVPEALNLLHHELLNGRELPVPAPRLAASYQPSTALVRYGV